LVITPRLTDGPDPLVALAASLQSRKVILLGPRPGLIREGEVLSMVDLTCELDEVAAALDAEGGAVLARCRAVIDGAAHPITVAISAPLGLLRELFTVRGSGTLIRRGARVVRHDGLTGVDADRFVGLLEASFAGALRPGFLERAVEHAYVAGDYLGIAVLTREHPAPYLSKFAVEARARGDGVGRDLWRALCRDHAAFFWRSRADNPITPWYVQQCDGMARTSSWHVFWRGLSGDDIPAAIEAALAAPVDLAPA